MDTQNSRKHFNHADLIEKIGDDKEFIEMLYSTYLDGFNKYLDKIKEAIATKDQLMLKNNAHALKGSSYSACFEIMGDYVYELEKSDVIQLEFLEHLISKIQDEKTVVDLAVKQFIENS